MRRILALLLLTIPLRAAEIRVLAAASLTDALGELSATYERRTGDRVILQFGASSLLARQIEAGAPADLFLSADEEKMNLLEQQGEIDSATRVSVLSNRLVIVVADGKALTHPRQLTDRAITSIALAEPSSVPAGIYAKAYLQKLGIWKAVAGKVIPTENVRAALGAVRSGNADAAIVYRSDVMTEKNVRVAYEVPRTDSPHISYPVAVLRHAEHPAAARRFLGWLCSKEAAAVFARLGFDVIR
jgi:molybdate transport system substrate-binding protein